MQEAIATDMARLAFTGSTLVAEAGGVIRGTGSLDGDRVRIMFVDPDWQRRGIGARQFLLRQLDLANGRVELTFYAGGMFEVSNSGGE